MPTASMKGIAVSSEFEADIVIDRPHDAVWDFLADHRHVPTWRDDVESVELVFGEPLSVGSRYQYAMRRRLRGLAGGSRFPLQLMQVSPRSCFTSQTLGGPADVEEETNLNHVSSGQTRVSIRTTVRLSGWRAVLAFLFPPLHSSRQRAIVRHLAALKRIVEASVPATTGSVPTRPATTRPQGA